MTNVTNAYAPQAAYVQQPAFANQQIVAPQAQAPVGNAAVATQFIPQAQAAPAPGVNANTAQGGGIIENAWNGVKDTLSGVVGFFKGQSDKAAQALATKGVDPNTGDVNQELLVASKKWETAYSMLSAAEKSRFDSEKETAMMWARG